MYIWLTTILAVMVDDEYTNTSIVLPDSTLLSLHRRSFYKWMLKNS